jgi:hypothetical protein
LRGHQSLGLIQQQVRHLASLRNDHPGGKLFSGYFFFFLPAFFFISLFNLDLDLTPALRARLFVPGIDTSFDPLLLEKLLDLIVGPMRPSIRSQYINALC